jgi:hypothetical protein
MNRRLFAGEKMGEAFPSLYLMVERLAEVARVAILEHLGFAAEDIATMIMDTRRYQYLASQQS